MREDPSVKKLRFLALLAFFFMATICYSQEMKATLDKFIGSDGIWKTDDGKYYIQRIAKHGYSNIEGAQLFIEVTLSSDGTTFHRKSIALLKDRTVLIIPVIMDANLKKELPTLMPGMKADDIGLYYFYPGEKFSPNGMDLTLEKIENEIGIWRDSKDEFYTIETAARQGQWSYILTEVKLDSSLSVSHYDSMPGKKIVQKQTETDELIDINPKENVDEGLKSNVGVTENVSNNVLKAFHDQAAEFLFKNNKLETAVTSIKIPESTHSRDRSDEIYNMFPEYDNVLNGNNEVRINNPNNYDIFIGIRSKNDGINFKIKANDTSSVFVPNGSYEIYFVYSDRKNELFKGDNFTLKNNGIEIKIVSVVGGNYGINRVNR